ncbi:hypothetical protein ANN_00814 [Periplaneta americana]|uniref:Uncharacterized protein n=1 Tax=Periplaneta americana TaxID=6978 RepID=A0ABQ8TVV1_PERAM|nr:hypothetical protein ANN_00814 [Periplaneta americana]
MPSETAASSSSTPSPAAATTAAPVVEAGSIEGDPWTTATEAALEEPRLASRLLVTCSHAEAEVDDYPIRMEISDDPPSRYSWLSQPDFAIYHTPQVHHDAGWASAPYTSRNFMRKCLPPKRTRTSAHFVTRMVLSVLRERNLPAPMVALVAQRFIDIHGRPISAKTVRRRLKASELISTKPATGPRLLRMHRVLFYVYLA